jgi:hypothetical protein
MQVLALEYFARADVAYSRPGVGRTHQHQQFDEQ